MYTLTTKINNSEFAVTGETAQQFKNNCQQIVTEALTDYILAVQEALHEAPTVAEKIVKEVFPNAEKIATKPAPQDDPFGDTPVKTNVKTCQHGEKTYRTGLRKNGTEWKAYFCPSKNPSDQCSPEWVK